MREKSTGFVILGILASGGDLSGYEIRQWIEQAIGFFWSESFGQIYPELQRLSKARLIKALPGGARGREVKRYRITAEGRKEIERWLEMPPSAERVRNELLLKVFFGMSAERNAVRRLLEDAVVALSQRQKNIDEAEKLVMAQDRSADSLVYSLITILSGQFVYSARLAWARSALAVFDAHAEGGNEAVLRAYAKAKKRMMGD